MLKKILIIVISIGLFVFLVFMLDSSYCTDKTHRGIFPVNPYCTKCHGADGFVQHKCTNPNGIDKYCPSCGKIVKDILK